MLNIIVCVKQVPDTKEVKIDPDKGTLIREGVPSILNPDDRNALEEALRIKDKNLNTNVKVITMGPPQAEEVLLEALSMGADEGILLCDKAFAGADTWATSNTLAKAIEKIGDYDLIFCGNQAIDGDTAQVGPQLAERLGLPQVTYVNEFDLKDETVTVKRSLEDGYETIEVKKPALFTIIEEINTPRYLYIDKIFEAYEKNNIQVWSNDELNIESSKLGLDGSPTQVKRTFTPEKEKEGEIIEGPPEEQAKTLLAKLKNKNVI